MHFVQHRLSLFICKIVFLQTLCLILLVHFKLTTKLFLLAYKWVGVLTEARAWLIFAAHSWSTGRNSSRSTCLEIRPA